MASRPQDVPKRSASTEQAATWSGVMHVFSTFGRGGAELRTWEVVCRTRQRFAFLTISGRPGSMDEEARAAGHLVSSVRVRGFFGVLRAARAMRSANIRVVHSHLGAASGPLLLAALMARVPIRIAHSRSDAVGGSPSFSKTVFLAVSRWIVRRTATEVVGVSPSALHGSGLVRGRWRTRATVVPNGIDADLLAHQGRELRSALGTSDNRLVVAHVARLERTKNRMRAIEIWSVLARQRTSTLKLIGPLNPDEAEAATAVAVDSDVRKMGSYVELVGETAEVSRHLSEADVLLVTSSREGLPGVVLESLASGTPVVSAVLPGVQWIDSLTTGVTALSLNDENDKWVRALIGVRRDREAIMRSFAESPFLISRAVEAHLALWGIDVPSEYRRGR
jgi:glycosyltransferase involved in cell wall biosynthesis